MMVQWLDLARLAEGPGSVLGQEPRCCKLCSTFKNKTINLKKKFKKKIYIYIIEYYTAIERPKYFTELKIKVSTDLSLF